MRLHAYLFLLVCEILAVVILCSCATKPVARAPVQSTNAVYSVPPMPRAPSDTDGFNQAFGVTAQPQVTMAAKSFIVLGAPFPVYSTQTLAWNTSGPGEGFTPNVIQESQDMQVWTNRCLIPTNMNELVVTEPVPSYFRFAYVTNPPSQ